MQLKYKNFEDLKINDNVGINTNSLNIAFNRLIDNDNSILPKQLISPQIWERKWYQDNSINGYSKGDAVWLNTESWEELITKKGNEIYNYSASNYSIRKLLDDYKESGESQKYNQTILKFAKGELDSSSGPLFYIGDITKQVQIRISTIDNNKYTPDVDFDNYGNRVWEDFFIRVDKEKTKLSILTKYNEQLIEKFNNHLKDYHLSGLIGNKEQIDDSYLHINLDNIIDKQTLQSHYWYENTKYGLDHIKLYSLKKFNNGVKWFRLWDSGFLEHGGIIDVENASSLGDTVNGMCYTVNLSWDNDNIKSPTYDYPQVDTEEMYNNEKYFINNDINSNLYLPDIGPTYRYSVQVTPLIDYNFTPYSKSSNKTYEQIDILLMNNSNFSILLNKTNCRRFSYIVNGYTLKTRKY